MRRLITILTIGGLLAIGPGMVFAAGPNHAGAQTYGWNLSGDVMPVPPYGSLDIPGSATTSKLLVNQPNGKVGAMVTGVMNGLLPNTTYTVYLSNPYQPYHRASVAGSYTMDVLYAGDHYTYDLNLTQTGTAIGGTLHDPYLPGTLPVTGTITGNNLSFSVDYGAGSVQGVRTFTGVIGSSGALSGTWTQTGTQGGGSTWSTTSGTATLSGGSTGWTGQLAGTEPITFTTDGAGSGSWHHNFVGPAPSAFSVWINASGGTVLISDNVTLD